MAGDTNYVVQLERPGAQPRRLYEIGDGDPCDEIAWSTDGATLAVLTSHVARLLFVDVDWALAHPTVQTGSWSWRVVDLGPGLTASHVTFVGSFEVNVLLRRGETTFTKRVLIPRPIVTGHGRTQ
jgi:hypothetical protein